ncbi:Y-family DNA polymerase [Chitinophaga niabensis]|uniref:Protein ImuB n=1 Tax=Chitinophaga niabensis TaxID=536979 RepID=A0A1N6E3Z6_9BACT|nr:DNA polymerase Y family protein [Chitinophaga niabensis]SIN77734.1 protein ImuB [Chitinophaga niabensis]
MEKRFVAIWFRYLETDWMIIRQPRLKGIPFVFSSKVHNRMLVAAASPDAERHGIYPGIPLADAKAILPALEVFDQKPDRKQNLLKGIGEWCIRYTPIAAVDLPDGLILDASGCAHLWGGENEYLKEITCRLRTAGYDVAAAISTTVGTSWAVARFGNEKIIAPGGQLEALMSLPPAALRLEESILQRLKKLGFYQISSFITMPPSVLRRRFGQQLLDRIAEAVGNKAEPITPLQIIAPYEERLPCLEPLKTATAIKIAIERLLHGLCHRMKSEGKGVRRARLKCFRIDGEIQQVEIGTSRASHHVEHLFKLFELQVQTIRPALGIDLFLLEAIKIEEVSQAQEKLWAGPPGLDNARVSELLDRVSNKVGSDAIHRYLPVEQNWPERSFKVAASLDEKPSTAWRTDYPRPVLILRQPEPIQVTAPIPDYPPMNFRYKGALYETRKADGPERIEREWWIEEGQHRDYYVVEDKNGQRFWLFRSGHYSEDQTQQWFIHGFFA